MPLSNKHRTNLGDEINSSCGVWSSEYSSLKHQQIQIQTHTPYKTFPANLFAELQLFGYIE